MKFYTRLAFYLFGLIIGVIFMLYFMMSKAESRNVTFCYLPNCRVLKDLRSKPFHYSEEALQAMRTFSIDTASVKNVLKDGDVDFKNSNVPFENGKVYVINHENPKLTLKVVNYTDKVVLKEVNLSKPTP
ncbi:MAG: DUF4258 domain-containing protein [Flavobacterium sp.]